MLNESTDRNNVNSKLNGLHLQKKTEIQEITLYKETVN